MYRKKIAGFFLSFLVVLNISCLVSLNADMHSQLGLINITEAANKGAAEDDDLSKADKATYRDLKSKSKNAKKNAVKNVNKLRDALAKIAAIIGGIMLGYSIIKYEMSFIDDNPMSKLDAATRMGAAIALIALPTLAVNIANNITANAKTKTVFVSVQNSIGSVAAVIGGVILGSGIFILLLSQANDNPNEQASAVKMIAVGAVMLATVGILKGIGITGYLFPKGSKSKATDAIRLAFVLLGP